MKSPAKFFMALIATIFAFSVSAANVEVFEFKSKTDDVYELSNGAVFKTTGVGYPGYISYHQQVIFVGHKVCLKGGMYDYELREEGRSPHYSISTYSGAEADAKYQELCGGI